MSVIHRFIRLEHGELRWQDVPVRAYGPDSSDTDQASRQVLIGSEEGSPHFHMRYFVVQPGGHTSFDQHAHDHGIYVLHGRARLRLGNEEHEIGVGDVVYISGNEVHQFFPVGEAIWLPLYCPCSAVMKERVLCVLSNTTRTMMCVLLICLCQTSSQVNF